MAHRARTSQQLEALSGRLLIERKIKDGAENLLQVFKLGGDKESLRSQVEAELAAADLKIEALDRRVRELRANINGEEGSSCLPKWRLTRVAAGEVASLVSEDSFSDGMWPLFDTVHELTDHTYRRQPYNCGFGSRSDKVFIGT